MAAKIKAMVEDLKEHINQTKSKDIEAKTDASFSEEHVRNELSDRFEPIGSGTTRHVYRITTDVYGNKNKGRVIKFANGEEERRYNMLERQTWMTFKGTELGEYFCPIRSFDPNGTWIIMDYAETNLSQQEADKVRETIENSLGSIIIDINRDNIGMHKNRGVVLIDYSWGGKF